MTTSPDLTCEILRYKSLVAADRFLLGLAEVLPPGPHPRAEWFRIGSNLAFRQFQLALVEYVASEQKAGFNPDQPRVPAGNPDGGQWMSEGPNNGLSSPAGSKPSAPISTPGLVLSDASPDPIEPGAQYAQAPTEIVIHPSGLTGISQIDDTSKSLVGTLARVMDVVEWVPDMTAQTYGTAVHVAFGTAVRLGNHPGLGFFDVETTFGAEPDAPYGSKGSIRTDILLRNEVGDIIAIYDLKTGEKGLTPGRVRELRQRTGVGPNIPIIELHAIRGVTLKYALVSGVFGSFRIYWGSAQ
ncbi:MAG: hypothetical protein HXX10_08860 [Rhodoplanes sp.]|uniref:hypothetical protein n=1 Tax=Rhodoplanes sp. TaxID=1968906 RepID=UPI0017F08B6E|nr:hypothetical protein [Rhodoplanes sp.]NVO14132.1 hypothetical protein [Rhodoplanes sp.]